MKSFHFKEALPLLDFFESHSQEIIGQKIKMLYIDHWPEIDRHIMSDMPVVLEMDNGCILLKYLIFSDLTITIGSKEEIKQLDGVETVMSIRDESTNYFEFAYQIKKDDIEGRRVINITVDRFSHAFEYNIRGDERPEGGDYFSTIRLHLDNGTVLCFCGADAEADGYIFSWCEKS